MDAVKTPCPFCRSMVMHVVVADNAKTEFVVMCMSCAAMGPARPLANAAIEMWNSRPRERILADTAARWRVRYEAGRKVAIRQRGKLMDIRNAIEGLDESID